MTDPKGLLLFPLKHFHDMLGTKFQHMLPGNTLSSVNGSKCNFIKLGKALTPYKNLNVGAIIPFQVQ